MLDGLSIIVEPGRSFIVLIFPQGKFRSAGESIGFTRGTRLGIMARVSVRRGVITRGKR